MFRYLLFDSSQHLRFHTKLQRWNVFYRSLFEGHAEASLPEIAPLLIDVTVDSDVTRKIIDETARIGQLKPCVSRLESELALVPLAEHLARFHLAETWDERSMLMRWYDTRILPVWLHVLTQEQREFFTHPITQWISIDRMGEEQQHDVGRQSDEMPAFAPMPFRLDEDQVGELFAASEPDALIFELRQSMRAQLDRIAPRILYPFVQAHWRMARQYGLREQREQIPFLQLALCTSGAFVAHPDAASLFAAPPERHPLASNWLNALPVSVAASGKPLWESPNYAIAPPTRKSP